MENLINIILFEHKLGRRIHACDSAGTITKSRFSLPGLGSFNFIYSYHNKVTPLQADHSCNNIIIIACCYYPTGCVDNIFVLYYLYSLADEGRPTRQQQVGWKPDPVQATHYYNMHTTITRPKITLPTYNHKTI